MTPQLEYESPRQLLWAFQRNLHPGLMILWRSCSYARYASVSPWNMAVPAEQLRSAGMGDLEFRLLIECGYVQHAREITLPGAERREFSRLGKASVTTDTSFVLTERGVGFVSSLLNYSLHNPTGSSMIHDADAPGFSDEVVSRPASDPDRPTWDARKRELRVGQVLVKRFRVPAHNQECVLAAFEEEDWPQCIDDPLPPDDDVHPKQRLHNTINGLNRNQRVPLIRFYGNGCGEAFCWEILLLPPDEESGAAAARRTTGRVN